MTTFPRADRETDSAANSTTARLLTAGAIAGPMFIVIALAQALTRDGFDWASHPTSMLALGDLGWIQIANFVIVAALYFGVAVGVRRTLRGRPAGTWAPILVGTFAVALLIAGIFPTDAGLGFPKGAPEGFPDFSWHGIVHSVGPSIGINAMFVSFFVFARHFAKTKQTLWTLTSIVAGVVGIALGSSVNLTGTGELNDPFNFLPLWFAMIVGWSYLSLLSWKINRDRGSDTSQTD